MKSIIVLGNGQLGRMLRQAGEPLGLNVYPVGVDAQPHELPTEEVIITAEIERWPTTSLTQYLSVQPNFVNRDVFSQLADRLPQKQLLDQLQLATAPWLELTTPSQWDIIFKALGDKVMVKSRIGGYDGRGQWVIEPGTEQALPVTLYGQSIVEQWQPFDAEVSLIGARCHQGKCVFYPLTANFHQQGMLRASVAQPMLTKQSQLYIQASQMLASIMQELHYVGVMAMECFVINGKLLINELAPRVHNSGHWTQQGASISQFAMHLRAICHLPLSLPRITAPAVMINLIGIPLNYQWLSLPLIHLHWYEKEVRPGRKVGHLIISDPNLTLVQETLTSLNLMLPNEYQESICWAKKQLAIEVVA